MEDKKIQWSKFNPDRSEQFVIRVETWEELVELKSKVEGIIPKANAFPDDSGHLATPQGHVQAAADICPIHKKPFRYGKFGKFCATKLPDGTWCKEKPRV